MMKMEENNFTTISGFLRELGKFDTNSRDKTRKHLKDIQIAFAQAVKDPKTEDELKISIQFAKMAVSLFASKGPKDYSIVVYPKSSKLFNKDMAEALAKQMGALSIEIKKIKSKDVKINRYEMMLRAQKMVERQHHKLENIENIQPTNTAWPQKWVDKEHRKISFQLPKDPEAEAEIKNLHGDKRRYAQLFGIDDPELFNGEPILVVDDNVAHQGTMEMLHALIDATEPARLDMYTPLLLPIK